MRLGGQGASLTGAARWVERTVWGAVVLVAAVGLGWWRGAPLWALPAVLGVPVVWG